MHSDGRAAGGTVLLLMALASPSTAGLITREEALAAVYPAATITAERLFLTADQQARAATLAGCTVPTALIARYLAVKDGQPVGRAYVDTHVVRTKKESLLISLDQDGSVRRIDVTAFLEPREYQAPDRWADQYRGKSLADDVNLQRAIRPVAGATLTAVAINSAVRRVLAIDRVLQGASDARGAR